ncbi:hypothetical protein BDM02DRAFT_3187660 [Thelephora ganbajun]|uniref:Uncharacterized protein n=1 Tax=Thelephora ganbajun TaxID=370292 RepID=A0ACB6ZE07_THEGA|nr:hypothetical protein BDM02DRAFT_3187660 [Thelephora ganbajun]
MGLSGRKIKQRIPQDPRNLSWADDASRFGSTYLSKLGFDHSDKNATLGTSGVGLTQHLKVHHKLDMLGIGAQHTKDPNGIAWKQNRDFENLLKRLNANLEGPAEDKVSYAAIDGFKPARVDEPVADRDNAGPETEGRDESRKAEKKRKKKKCLRDDDETAKMEKSKKRMKAESTSATPGSEPVEFNPSSSNSPTPESTAIARKPHRNGRAHRARFIASKRLAATSSVAVAEILGISSSSTTPLSVSSVATPEVISRVEDDEYGHLTVSSKSVADYFKEKMRPVVLKPLGFEMGTNEGPRGGIGSWLNIRSHDKVEEGGRLCGGLGMGLLVKMSAAEATTEIFVQEERRKRKHRSEDDEGEVEHKPKKKGIKRAQTASY